MENLGIHRPRTVGWARAAALLYGDWGTSKAYVIGAAFYASAYASLPIIVAVSVLTGLVGFNYIVVCKHFPEGGGVYSSARLQSRVLAVIGSLLLVADLTVTASLSGWAAMNYFEVPKENLVYMTIGAILIIGIFNSFGPKHSGSMALTLALPTVVVVLTIAALSLPHLTTAHLEPLNQPVSKNWTNFVGVILALSGVEAIANLTGVMKLDPGSTMEKPSIRRTSRKAILLVALEVVIGTSLLGWAMLSLPPDVAPQLREHWEDMLTQLAVHYGQISFGVHFGTILGFATAIIVGLLLLSAVNTAVVALIGLLYLLARDGEMPKAFAVLNRHGVPWLPILIATALPIVVVAFSPDQLSLMELYAIGVVGAITVNLGSCAFNKNLKLAWHERTLMAFTTAILLAVEITLAKTKPNALFFVVCILVAGFSLRAYAQKRAAKSAALVPESAATRKPFPPAPVATTSLMVAARGFTPVLRFALEEARLREATLYVLYVRAVAVSLPGVPNLPGPSRWQDDPQATEIIHGMFELGRESGVHVVPLYAVSEDPSATIVTAAMQARVNILILGVPHRRTLVTLLKGDVVTEVAGSLPENIHLIIHG
jgi:amino acid transporter/nucleotide-binding universal stress UspA family protein